MEDVAFIQNQEIGKVLSKGLAMLYEQQPGKPIEYLAHWLLNHSGTIFIQTWQKKEIYLNNNTSRMTWTWRIT